MGKLIDRFKNPKTVVGKWCLNMFIAWDQLFNAARGGDPDETISSDLGKDQKAGTLNPLENVIAEGLNVIDPNHCQKAIEADEGKDSIKNFIKGRKREKAS